MYIIIFILYYNITKISVAFFLLGGEGSKRLKQVEVDVYSNSECEKAYRNSSIAVKIFPQGMKRELLCAGSPNGGKDACQVRKYNAESINK